MQDNGVLCALWDGQTTDVARKSSESFRLENPKLSMLIQVQPKIFDRYLKKKGAEARSSGLLARFLICEPISTIGFRYTHNQPSSFPYLEFFEKRLKFLYNYNENVVLKFTPEAQALWDFHYNCIEQAMAPNSQSYQVNHRDYGSKIPENTARIAALLHLLSSDEKEIPIEPLQSAIAITNWYQSEFVRIFQEHNVEDPFITDCNSLLEFLNRTHSYGIHYVRRRIILQYGPPRLRKRAALDNVLDFLASQGMCFIYTLNKTTYVSLYQMPVNNQVQPVALLN